MWFQTTGTMVGHCRGPVCTSLNLGTLFEGRGPGGRRGRALALYLPPGQGGEYEGKPLPLALPLKVNVVTAPRYLSTMHLITPRAHALPICTIGGGREISDLPLFS